MNPEHVLALLMDLYANLQLKTEQANKFAARVNELIDENTALKSRIADLESAEAGQPRRKPADA